MNHRMARPFGSVAKARVPLRLPQRSVAGIETSIALCSSRKENDDLSTRFN
jgi:hypothetical protein